MPRVKVTVSPLEKNKIIQNFMDALADTEIEKDNFIGIYAISKDGESFEVKADTTIKQDLKGREFKFFDEKKIQALINQHVSELPVYEQPFILKSDLSKEEIKKIAGSIPAGPWIIQPEPSKTIPIKSITASSYSKDNTPQKILDKSLNTRWSAKITEKQKPYVTLDLGTKQKVSSVGIAWYQGDKRQYTFDVDYTDDPSHNSIPIILGQKSSGKTFHIENYPLPDPVETRFIEIIIKSNNQNDWASITRVELK